MNLIVNLHRKLLLLLRVKGAEGGIAFCRICSPLEVCLECRFACLLASICGWCRHTPWVCQLKISFWNILFLKLSNFSIFRKIKLQIY